MLAITAATDGLMRGLYCRRCKTRQTVTLSGGQPAPPVPPPRDVPTRATPQRPPVTPPIETVGIRDRRG